MTLSRQVCGWSLPQEGRLPAAATSTHRSMHLRRPGKRHLSTGKDTLAHGSSSVYLLFFGACPPRSSGDSGFDRGLRWLQAPCGRRSSSAITAAAARACSSWSGGKEIAATAGWPPPPYRSAIRARLCRRCCCFHGFEPSEILLRFGPCETET